MAAWRNCVAAMVVVVWSAAGALAQPAAPLPGMDELRQELKEGKDYPGLLQKVTRVLQLKGAAAAPYDRVELQEMRGETLLHLKQQAPAVQAFQAALKESQGDPKNPKAQTAATATEQRRIRAMLLLLSKSQNFEYRPKVKPASGDGGPFSVVDPEQRKAAYKALLDEQMTEVTAKAKAARAGKQLKPVVEAVRLAIDLRALEETVNDNSQQTDGVLKDCAARAGELMGDEVTRAEKADEAIDRVAHETVLLPSTGSGSNTSPPRYKYKGLSTADKQTLKGNVDGLQTIAAAAHDFGDLGAPATGAANFKKIDADATSAADKATKTLNENYNVMLSSPRTGR